MLIEELIINEEMPVLQAMQLLNDKEKKILFIAPDLKLKAVLTDGDIRRRQKEVHIFAALNCEIGEFGLQIKFPGLLQFAFPGEVQNLETVSGKVAERLRKILVEYCRSLTSSEDQNGGRFAVKVCRKLAVEFTNRFAFGYPQFFDKRLAYRHTGLKSPAFRPVAVDRRIADRQNS